MKVQAFFFSHGIDNSNTTKLYFAEILILFLDLRISVSGGKYVLGLSNYIISLT